MVIGLAYCFITKYHFITVTPNRAGGRITMETLDDILETTVFDKIAGGFVFTEGPVWHPDGFFYFVDVRDNKLFRIEPGHKHELVRVTGGGNGTTFDLQGRLINCEGDSRRLTRTEADGAVTILLDQHEGQRLNRPNDVICRSDGTLFFTDPALRVPIRNRDVGEGAVYRLTPDGACHRVAWVEYPNGLALSPDERPSTSPTHAGRSISTRSNWTPRARCCAGGYSPTCPSTPPTACRMG